MPDNHPNLEPLLPSLLDIGINTITPLECAAGMQALELRRKFPELRMIGNLSREALMKGRAAIEEEVRADRIWIWCSSRGVIPRRKTSSTESI